MCESQYEWLSVSVCYPSHINEPVLHRVCNPGLNVVFNGSSFADILLVIFSFSLHLLKQHSSNILYIPYVETVFSRTDFGEITNS